MAVIIGNNPAILKMGCNMPKVLSMSAQEIEVTYGVTKTVAQKLAAVSEMNRRKKRAEQQKLITTIRKSSDSYAALEGYMADLDVEHFYIILLNRANRIIGIEKISEGGVSGTLVDAKIVFRRALLKKASCIILAHNHPSGSLAPSQADIELTKKIVKAAEVLDIIVLDHIIYTNTSYYSFADEGNM